MEYKWVALSNTTIGVLMASLDINIVLIALPTIGKNLSGMNAFNVLWVILGYQLVIASVLVNFGRLSDIFGRVRLYTIGFAQCNPFVLHLFHSNSTIFTAADSGNTEPNQIWDSMDMPKSIKNVCKLY